MAHQKNKLMRKQHHGNTLTECLFSRSTLAVKSNTNNDIIQIYIHKKVLKNSYIINNGCTKLMFLFRTVTNIADAAQNANKENKAGISGGAGGAGDGEQEGLKQKKLTMQTTMMLDKQESIQRRERKWMPSKNDF